jgi:hypothetical protein
MPQLVQVKSYLRPISLLARIPLLALAAAASAQAAVSFNAPTASFDTHDDNC